MNRPEKIKELKEEVMKLIDCIFGEEEITVTPAKTPKFFVPKRGEDYWAINPFAGVGRITNTNTAGDRITISLGVYRTEEEAKKAFEKQKALVRLWKNADEKYYFRPDWGDRKQVKYEVIFDPFEVRFEPNGYEDFMPPLSPLPYFATKEDAENFIKENEKDLEIYCLD